VWNPDDWGSFHLTCNSKGKETREAVTAADVEQLNTRFATGDELKDALKKRSSFPPKA
jgi:hypothetical protein